MSLHSGSRVLRKAATTVARPDFPLDEGCFRPVKIVYPPRTIFTAERLAVPAHRTGGERSRIRRRTGRDEVYGDRARVPETLDKITWLVTGTGARDAGWNVDAVVAAGCGYGMPVDAAAPLARGFSARRRSTTNVGILGYSGKRS